MKDWEADLKRYRILPAPPKMPLQEYIERCLSEKDSQYFDWFLNAYERKLNKIISGIVQRYAMYGHFEDLKQSYIIGIWNALAVYDPSRGVPFEKFMRVYCNSEIDEYVRTMRTGYTVPKKSEYTDLKKVIRLYREYGEKSDPEALERIHAQTGISTDTLKEMLVGALRNQHPLELHDDEYDEDGENDPPVFEERVPDYSSDPMCVWLEHQKADAVFGAFCSLSVREQMTVSKRLNICPDCLDVREPVTDEYGSVSFRERERYQKFEDIALEFGERRSTVQRVFHGAIEKMRKNIIAKAAEMKKNLVIECVPEQEKTKHLALANGFYRKY